MQRTIGKVIPAVGAIAIAIALVLGCAQARDREHSGQARGALVNSPSRPWSIANVNSGLCLDVPNGTFFVGAPVNQYVCNAGSSQTWRITDWGFISTPDDQWCIDVDSSNMLVVQPCDWSGSTTTQLWLVFSSSTSNQIGAIADWADEMCIDVPGLSTGVQVQLQKFPCNQGLNQQWVGLPL